MKKDLLIKDFEKNYNVKINNINVIKEDNGLVLNLDDKYILKEMNERDFKATKLFESYYKFVKGFRKAIYVSDNNSYMVYEFIEEDRNIDYNKIKIFNQIYDLVKEERRYESESYGYLFEDNKTWYQFLADEVNYSIKQLNDKLDTKIVLKALKIVKKEKIEPYLLHGDLGVHNFIVKDKIINTIDPIGVVGDYLYDFYYAILSNYSITDNLDIEFVLSYFDRKLKYKKALFIVVYFIRMVRAYKYNKTDYELFLSDYKYLSLK